MKILQFPVISEEEKQRVLVLKQETELKAQRETIEMLKRRLLRLEAAKREKTSDNR
jgi:hypothetical protein